MYSSKPMVAAVLVLLLIGPTFADDPFDDASASINFKRGSVGLSSEGLGGAAWLDYDGDGDLDLFLPNRKFRLNALYRNNGDGTFRNVSLVARVANGRGNKSALAADLDNDGCTDLFLTGEGSMVGPWESPTKLYINNCDGTFTDKSNGDGISGPVPALMAAAGDINNDRLLDLFITSPGSFFSGRQTRNKLYLNNGDHTFTDISESARVDTALGGCVIGFNDYDQDGWIDIYMGNCNDLGLVPTPFELFRNNGDLTFTDVAHDAGLDLGGFWMSIAFGDHDRDGDLDLFSTSGGISMPGKPFHALFRNNGDQSYTDVALEAGVAAWEFGWGSAFADFDNDGDEDLIFTGSFPPFGISGEGKGNPGRLFENDGSGSFSMEASYGLEDKYSSGLAVADYDENGFPDVVIVSSRLRWPVRSLLLRNTGNDNNWITVQTVGTASNRDGIGARVKLMTNDGRAWAKLVSAGSSFLSTHSPWPTFGLGQDETADLVVEWPSGLVESFSVQQVNRKITVVEGTGSQL